MIAAIGWRDLLMVVVGFGLLPLALYNAYYGLLAYCWLSFMRPHQSLIWNPSVMATRFTFFVGIVLIFRALTTPGPKFRLKAPTIFFVGFWVWMVVCTVMSTYQAESTVFLEKFSKIGIAAMLLTGLVGTRRQLKWMVVLLAWCPGFYAVKLGLYLLTGGSTVTHHGGPEGFDNNDIALFVAMAFPMLIFGAVEIRHIWLRRGMYVAAAMCVPAVIVGESRGGMLAMAASLVITLWRRVGTWKTAVVLALALPVILAIVPQKTMWRYKSLEAYTGDVAAIGRLNAWKVATRMAEANPTTGIGMGVDVFLAEYDKYKIETEDWPHVAHSVWFSALAGMGYPGLALFVLLILATFWTTRRVRRLARDSLGDTGRWAASYATGIETAVVAFAIGGSFLSQIGFEYVYAVMLLSVPLHAIVQGEITAVESGETVLAAGDGPEALESAA